MKGPAKAAALFTVIEAFTPSGAQACDRGCPETAAPRAAVTRPAPAAAPTIIAGREVVTTTTTTTREFLVVIPQQHRQVKSERPKGKTAAKSNLDCPGCGGGGD